MAKIDSIQTLPDNFCLIYILRHPVEIFKLETVMICYIKKILFSSASKALMSLALFIPIFMLPACGGGSDVANVAAVEYKNDLTPSTTKALAEQSADEFKATTASSTPSCDADCQRDLGMAFARMDFNAFLVFYTGKFEPTMLDVSPEVIWNEYKNARFLKDLPKLELSSIKNNFDTRVQALNAIFSFQITKDNFYKEIRNKLSATSSRPANINYLYSAAEYTKYSTWIKNLTDTNLKRIVNDEHMLLRRIQSFLLATDSTALRSFNARVNTYENEVSSRRRLVPRAPNQEDAELVGTKNSNGIYTKVTGMNLLRKFFPIQRPKLVYNTTIEMAAFSGKVTYSNHVSLDSRIANGSEYASTRLRGSLKHNDILLDGNATYQFDLNSEYRVSNDEIASIRTLAALEAIAQNATDSLLPSLAQNQRLIENITTHFADVVPDPYHAHVIGASVASWISSFEVLRVRMGVKAGTYELAGITDSLQNAITRQLTDSEIALSSTVQKKVMYSSGVILGSYLLSTSLSAQATDAIIEKVELNPNATIDEIIQTAQAKFDGGLRTVKGATTLASNVMFITTAFTKINTPNRQMRAFYTGRIFTAGDFVAGVGLMGPAAINMYYKRWPTREQFIKSLDGSVQIFLSVGPMRELASAIWGGNWRMTPTDGQPTALIYSVANSCASCTIASYNLISNIFYDTFSFLKEEPEIALNLIDTFHNYSATDKYVRYNNTHN